MLDSILDVLEKNNIREYIITENKRESVGLYFIKKDLDMNRKKYIVIYKVRVFNSFSKGGKKYKGDSIVTIYPSMNINEIDEIIKGAYFEASFGTNKSYKIPSGYIGEEVIVESKFQNYSLEEAALIIRGALYKNDIFEKGFINSSEIFVHRDEKRIINSRGADAAYIKYKTDGEFITQWIENNDVEIYNSFNFNDMELEELASRVKNAIIYTGYRDKAKNPPKTGIYNVLLSGQNVTSILEYYIVNSKAQMIYEKYSTFRIGHNIQGHDVKGDKLNITLTSSVPFSNEGIELKDRVLIKDGKLKTLHGSFRFADYLGITPTGEYDGAFVEGGSISEEDMFQNGDIHIVKFSDFQMDSLTGDFLGEIRLALLKAGDRIVPLTGGSLIGNIKDVQGNLLLSKEIQIDGPYKVPAKIKLHDIQISGE